MNDRGRLTWSGAVMGLFVIGVLGGLGPVLYSLINTQLAGAPRLVQLIAFSVLPVATFVFIAILVGRAQGGLRL